MKAVLAQPAFRRLFASQVLSTFGDRIVVVALALYVSQIGTPTDVGIVLAAQTIPFVALLLLGGVWADRLPRQRVMFWTDVIRGVLHAGLAALIFTGAVTIWAIVAIEVLFAAAHAFFRPAYTGLVPQTVPEELLQQAQALNGAVYPIASFAGPAAATALVLGVGPGWAFAVDAATFFVSAALLIGLRPRARGAVGPPAPLLAEIRAGWHEVTSRRWVWVVIVTAAVIVTLANAPFYTLGPTVAAELHGNAAVFGWVVVAFGAGNLLGSIIAFRWQPRRPLATGLVLSTAWVLSYGLFALPVGIALILAAAAAGSAGVTLFIIWWDTTLARGVPPHALSRVAAYDWMGSLGLVPIGYLLAGPLAERFGAEEVLIGGAVLGVVAILAALAVREVRQNDGMPASVVDASA